MKIKKQIKIYKITFAAIYFILVPPLLFYCTNHSHDIVQDNMSPFPLAILCFLIMFLFILIALIYKK